MSKWTWEGFWERVIGAFKYLMGVSMMVSGVQTAFFLAPFDGASLGWLYQSRTAMVVFGLIFFVSGAMLFFGKLFRRRRIVGHGLFFIFCCYTFATVLQYVAYAGAAEAWVVNGVVAVVMGLLYLRWRFKTAYVDPEHFRDDRRELSFDEYNRLAARDSKVHGSRPSRRVRLRDGGRGT